jgi:formiminoglutamase
MLNNNFSFQLTRKEDYDWSERDGETKLWEEFTFGLPNSNTEFVLLGINEDIGPQMNFGNSGSKFGFKSSIEKLGQQVSNQFLSGKEICVLGTIEQKIDFTPEMIGRSIINDLDLLVEEVIQTHLKNGQRLIVIGGGHNNALPILRFFNKQQEKKISVLNIDPHADCRSTEYRHSGNSFSFASEERLLKNYHVLGLHEGYNNDFILNFLDSNKFSYQTFEYFLDNPIEFEQQFTNLCNSFDSPAGLEIDLDSIRHFPCSALTPSGFSLEETRKFARSFSRKLKPLYLHLPESAPLTINEENLVGKAIGYLIADFIKVIKSSNYMTKN